MGLLENSTDEIVIDVLKSVIPGHPLMALCDVNFVVHWQMHIKRLILTENQGRTRPESPICSKTTQNMLMANIYKLFLI